MEALQVTQTKPIRSKREMVIMSIFFGILAGGLIMLFLNPAFADTGNNLDFTNNLSDGDYRGLMGNILSTVISIVGMIFQVIGIILSIYAVGQLILAFKNEDANAKSSSSMLLVVGIALIAVPIILNSINWTSLIGFGTNSNLGG